MHIELDSHHVCLLGLGCLTHSKQLLCIARQGGTPSGGRGTTHPLWELSEVSFVDIVVPLIVLQTPSAPSVLFLTPPFEI